MRLRLNGLRKCRRTSSSCCASVVIPGHHGQSHLGYHFGTTDLGAVFHPAICFGKTTMLSQRTFFWLSQRTFGHSKQNIINNDLVWQIAKVKFSFTSAKSNECTFKWQTNLGDFKIVLSFIRWQAIFEETGVTWNEILVTQWWAGHTLASFVLHLTNNFFSPLLSQHVKIVTWKLSTAFTCFHYVCINDFVKWLRDEWYFHSHGLDHLVKSGLMFIQTVQVCKFEFSHFSPPNPILFPQNGDISWHFKQASNAGDDILFHAKIDCTLGSKPLLHLPLERPEKPPRDQTGNGRISSLIQNIQNLNHA